ncbi:hypothetical protein KR222_008616, partial [Zaprionus bogoriensis]
SWQTFSSACLKQPFSHRYVQVDGSLREVILQYVNVLRNSVASGLFNMSSAARMPTMSWDDDLAFASRVLVHNCDYDGKICTNMNKYNYVANVEVKGSYPARHLRLYSDMRRVYMPIWLSDVFGCHMTPTGRIQPNEEGKCVGHYLPVLQDLNDRMGCAIRQSESPQANGTSYITLICSMSRASVNNMVPYKVAKMPGEQCETGMSPLYDYLCSKDEEVDHNYV